MVGSVTSSASDLDSPLSILFRTGLLDVGCQIVGLLFYFYGSSNWSSGPMFGVGYHFVTNEIDDMRRCSHMLRR